VVSEPCFQLGETGTALARLRFSDDRRFTTAEGIKIEIVSAAAEAAGATQRIAFCMHADGFVAFDQFTLATISLATMTGSTHGCYSAISGDGAGLGSTTPSSSSPSSHSMR